MVINGLFTVLMLCLLIAEEAIAQPDTSQNLVILYTNDLHNRLNGFSPGIRYPPPSSNHDETCGGFARISALIKDEREKNGDNVLVLDAGDFLIGTFFSMLEESSGFQLSLMKKMGYDVVTLGNHEFDLGPQALANIIGKSVENGSVPSIVASNLLFSKRNSADDALKGLFDQQVLKPYLILEKKGLRIGIFGILGKMATDMAPMVYPVRFKDPVKTAREYAAFLKETEKADVVICISHSGINLEEDGGWTGEDAELAAKVPAIDLIISGHTHILLEQPAIINGTPVLCAGSLGAWLGRYEMTFVDGHLSQADSRVIPVTNEISPDTLIQYLIAEQEGKVIDRILKPYHLLDTTTIVETSFPLVCNIDTMPEESNLGPLISDAIYHYVNSHHQPGSDITFFPAGLVADNIMPRETGRQSVADIFRIAPLGCGKDSIPGYPLARAYVTGHELKGMMEILYMAPSFSKDFYLYTGGLRATFDPRRGLLRKITSIEIGNPETGFVPVDFSKSNTKLYSVTADSYVLGFANLIRKLTRRLVSIDLKNERGELIGSVDNALLDASPDEPGVQEVKEWMALIWFLQQQPDSNDNGIGDIPDYYRTVSPRLHLKQNPPPVAD